MRTLIRTTALAASVAALVPATAAAQSCPTPPAADVGAARAAVLCLVNAERTSRGLPALREQRQLRTAARRYAHRMVRQQFFSHARRDMVRRVRATGFLRRFPHWSLGENIAWGQAAAGSAAAIVDDWMASPAHRANILNRRFSLIGIGVAHGAPVAGASGATYVTDFGVRRR